MSPKKVIYGNRLHSQQWRAIHKKANRNAENPYKTFLQAGLNHSHFRWDVPRRIEAIRMRGESGRAWHIEKRQGRVKMAKHTADDGRVTRTSDRLHQWQLQRN